MNTFKVGDIVRFADNELNRVEPIYSTMGLVKYEVGSVATVKFVRGPAVILTLFSNGEWSEFVTLHYSRFELLKEDN